MVKIHQEPIVNKLLLLKFDLLFNRYLIVETIDETESNREKESVSSRTDKREAQSTAVAPTTADPTTITNVNSFSKLYNDINLFLEYSEIITSSISCSSTTINSSKRSKKFNIYLRNKIFHSLSLSLLLFIS